MRRNVRRRSSGVPSGAGKVPSERGRGAERLAGLVVQHRRGTAARPRERAAWRLEPGRYRLVAPARPPLLVKQPWLLKRRPRAQLSVLSVLVAAIAQRADESSIPLLLFSIDSRLFFDVRLQLVSLVRVVRRQLRIAVLVVLVALVAVRLIHVNLVFVCLLAVRVGFHLHFIRGLWNVLFFGLEVG